MPQGRHAVLPDGKGQRTEGADRGEAHQVAKDAKHHGRGRLQHIEYRLALLAHGRQGKTAEHRDEQHRQHFTLVERPDERVGNDMHEEVDHAELRRRCGVLAEPRSAESGRVDVHADTRTEQVYRCQADHQADDSQYQEQQQGLAHQTPEGALVGHPGDTGDDGAEDHRRDHHLDQLDERITQGLSATACCAQK